MRTRDRVRDRVRDRMRDRVRDRRRETRSCARSPGCTHEIAGGKELVERLVLDVVAEQALARDVLLEFLPVHFAVGIVVPPLHAFGSVRRGRVASAGWRERCVHVACGMWHAACVYVACGALHLHKIDEVRVTLGKRRAQFAFQGNAPAHRVEPRRLRFELLGLARHRAQAIRHAPQLCRDARDARALRRDLVSLGDRLREGTAAQRDRPRVRTPGRHVAWSSRTSWTM